jgi:hypothetical protein
MIKKAAQATAELKTFLETNSLATSGMQEMSNISLTQHRYGVIYADPPWSFRTWSAKGTGRSAISHYDCLSFEG